MMRIRAGITLAAGALLVMGCRADREVFDEGATLAPPTEVQEAPAWPQEPQPIGPAATTDTALLDTLGQPGAARQPGAAGQADTLGSPQPIRP
jgi:hypothetical protein